MVLNRAGFYKAVKYLFLVFEFLNGAKARVYDLPGRVSELYASFQLSTG